MCALILIGNNIFHWELRLRGFDETTRLGQELIAFTVATQEEYMIRYTEPTEEGGARRVIPVDVVFEIKLPSNYPYGTPLFRVIRPRFLTQDGNSAPHEFDLGQDDLSEQEEEPQELSLSMALEKRSWSAPTLIELARQVRTMLFRAQNLHVDMTSSLRGIPTQVPTCVILLSTSFHCRERSGTIMCA